MNSYDYIYYLDHTQVPNHEESGDEGITPIAVATKTEDIEMVKMLLKHGAEIDGIGPAGRVAIHEGSGKGLTKMCSALLTSGANQELPAAGFLNATPVVIAAIMRHHRTVELFLTVSERGLGYLYRVCHLRVKR